MDVTLLIGLARVLERSQVFAHSAAHSWRRQPRSCSTPVVGPGCRKQPVTVRTLFDVHVGMSYALSERMEVFTGAVMVVSGMLLFLGRDEQQVMSHEWLHEYLRTADHQTDDEPL